MTVPFAVAYSEHPVAADAAGEVIGRIVESVGARVDAGRGTVPDLVIVFASAAHAHFLGEVTSAVANVLQPDVLVGVAAHSVIGGRSESADSSAISVFASWNGQVQPVRLTAQADAPGGMVAVDGLPDDMERGATLLLIADPETFPAEPLIDELAQLRPDVTVVGGLASSGGDGSALVLDGAGYTDGAVGVLIPLDQLVGPVVSQGCRPVGRPMVVTSAHGGYVLELDDGPALERLNELVADADDTTRALLAGGVQLGIAVDGRRNHAGEADYLVRSVLGADRQRGVLAIGGRAEEGATVRFHTRDATTASEDLYRSLSGVTGEAALLFTCTGRGPAMFSDEDHDASLVAETVGTDTVAGISCAGEFGPVGGRSHVHGYTASVLVFATAEHR